LYLIKTIYQGEIVMANIQISPILPVGYDLFNDANSFLNELATEEVQNIFGEGYHSASYSASYSGGYSGGYSASGSYSGGYSASGSYSSQQWGDYC
jgi:hypothetical protein